MARQVAAMAPQSLSVAVVPPLDAEPMPAEIDDACAQQIVESVPQLLPNGLQRVTQTPDLAASDGTDAAGMSSDSSAG